MGVITAILTSHITNQAQGIKIMLHVSVNQPRNEKNTTTFPPYKLSLFNNLPKPTGVQLNIMIRSTESTVNSNSQYLFLPTPLLLSRPLGWYLISCLDTWEMNNMCGKNMGTPVFLLFGFCIRKWWKWKVKGMLKGLRWYLEFLFAYSLPGLSLQARQVGCKSFGHWCRSTAIIWLRIYLNLSL